MEQRDDEFRFFALALTAVTIVVLAAVGSYAIPTLVAPEAAVINGLLR